MLIKKISATSHKLKALVYWPSGAWKTVFWSTAPKPIFASAEGWLLSISNSWGDFVNITSENDLVELLQYLKTEKHDYQTVVIDSITEINDVIRTWIEKRNSRSMNLQDWGELWRKIRGILWEFRNLNMNVLFIAQEIVEKDEEKISQIKPSLNGKNATEIAYFMDVVAYLYIDKEWNRKINTSWNSKLLSKDRSWLLTDPDDINFASWCTKIEKIKIIDKTVWKFWTDDELLKQIEKELNECETIDELEGFFKQNKPTNQAVLNIFTKRKNELNKAI